MGSSGEATLRGLVMAALVLIVLFVAGFATGVALARDTGPAQTLTTGTGSGGATALAGPRTPFLR